MMMEQVNMKQLLHRSAWSKLTEIKNEIFILSDFVICKLFL